MLRYQVMVEASCPWMGQHFLQMMWTMIYIQVLVQGHIQVDGGFRIALLSLSILMVLTMIMRKWGIKNRYIGIDGVIRKKA